MKILLLFLLMIVLVMVIVVSAMGCHPSATGWGLWFFVFLGGFCLLGL